MELRRTAWKGSDEKVSEENIVLERDVHVMETYKGRY
jgi:hypothetical protein